MGCKYCFVPKCFNSSTNSDRLFLTVPRDTNLRQIWFEAVGRGKEFIPKTVRLYCCEDHFDLEKDADNWIEFQMIGRRIILKPNVVPHRNILGNFEPRSESQFSPAAKKRKMETIERFESTKAESSKTVEIVKPESFDVEIQVDLLNAPKLSLCVASTSHNQPTSTRAKPETTSSSNIEQLDIKEESLKMNYNDYKLYHVLRDSVKEELVCNDSESETEQNICTSPISIKEEPVNEESSDSSEFDNEVTVNHENINTANDSLFEYVFIKEEPCEEEFNL